MSAQPNINLWTTAEHALEYLRRADSIPHRVEGEAALLEFLPTRAKRILDLGSGAGRLLGLLSVARPETNFVALDFSATMLAALHDRFASDARPKATPVSGDLRSVDAERGVLNLEHVASPTIDLHHESLSKLDLRPGEEDPSNKLLDVET